TQRVRFWKTSGKPVNSGLDTQPQMSPCITAHHRKEGWPSDQENIAKHPPIARTGWFSDKNKRKTTPSASASVASRNFFDDSDTPPCSDARRGIALDCNLFTGPNSDSRLSIDSYF